MDDLLKEAIADAKAVRETALENAKIALEEAFTPRLQSMLSKKIQSEMDVDEQDDEMEDEDEEEMEDEEAPEEGSYHEDDEDPSDEDSEMDIEDEDEIEGVDESDIIEINGVKYAPVIEQDEEDMGDEEDEEDMEEADEFDLEAVLRELEEDDEVDEAAEPKEEVDETKETEEVDEAKDTEEVDEAKDTEEDDEAEEVEEEIDLEEVIKALEEEEDEESKIDKVAKIQSDLDEHRNVVKYLRSKLNEVNLLNAKLLFTNKLFRSFGLSNDQKMKVVENFDRARNLREVKLVYSTLAESFGTTTTKHEIKEHKGSASKAVASTKSKKQEIIAEGSELRDRFKKLAGIV